MKMEIKTWSSDGKLILHVYHYDTMIYMDSLGLTRGNKGTIIRWN